MTVADDDSLLDARFLARLEQLRLQVRRTFAGTLRADRRSRRTGSSLEFADYRNYTRGDDPRRIDWSIYGRLGRLMVKLYEEEEDLDVSILVDASFSMRWRPNGADRTSKFTLARQLAAALAYLGLHGLDRVALWFFDQSLGARSGELRGRTAIHDALGFLGQVPDGRRGTDLQESLTAFGRNRRRRGLAIVVSDCLDRNVLPALATVVGRHFSLHLLHVLDPAECDPAETGDLLLQDCETGAEATVSAGPSLARAYREEVERFREEIRAWCARHTAGYSFVRADATLEDVVLRALRADGLVR